MKYLLLTILSIVSCLTANAQLSGHVDYPELGVSFDIPSGWVGQETEEMIVLGSNSIPGLIIVQPHEYGINELRQQAREGMNEGNGTVFQLMGNLENLNSNAIGGEFAGTLEFEAAKSYIVGIANPYGKGTGAIIMAITTPANFNATYKNVCLQLFRSFRFKKVDHSSKIKEWKDYLSDSRLTYMDSYYSGSSTAGGISGGYDSKTTIDLCGRGYFNFNSNSSVSAGGSGISAYSTSGKAGQGTWDVEVSGGQLILALTYHNGEKRIFEMEYKDEKFYLDGSRYFVTSEGEYAPNCN
ncbi:MAG: hypothetical protein AAFQ94_20375 [Bacteroidota bacterium]